MKKHLLLSILLLASLLIGAHSSVAVFTSGMDGYKSFRIPAVISLFDGTLLAFAEGRVNGSGDYGNIDVVLKRSTDMGKTWSNLSVVVDNADLQAGNAAPVVDSFDPKYPKGRIFLFYNTGNNHESEVMKGNGVKKCWYKTSVDGGLTWSSPVDITTQVHRPLQLGINKEYNFVEDWRCYANTPGHAVQLEEGVYKGRIYVAANHSYGNPQKRAAHYKSHGYFSDDHGASFHLGTSLDVPGGNESMAVELSDGKVMVNSRNQSGNMRMRIVAISSSGGQNWDTTYFDSKLPDPVCQASILKVGKKKGKNIIAFCNPASKTERNKLTLRISKDDANTWSASYLIYSGPSGSNTDYSAYSDMVLLRKNKIGILYEQDNYAKIMFTTQCWK